MGGEKHNVFTLGSLVQGSPPHGRGKGNRHSVPSGFTGITPAWAGKSGRIQEPFHPYQDHPRVGGEKPIVIPCRLASRGSPPRERGKGKARNAVTHQLRITPAWAGKSMTAPGRSSRTGNHPRVGGEKIKAIRDEVGLKGSPPRGQGKAWHLSHGLLPCG